MPVRPHRPEDLQTVQDLLSSESLPTDILEHTKGVLWVLDENGAVVGSGALEIYDQDALLRSVVVAPQRKGRGDGGRIVEHIEREARERGVKTLWLLTETAEGFFAKRGYTRVERSIIINKGILDSDEFKHLCASTAACMKKSL